MHNIPDMIKGLNIGEIGQFSSDPKPYKLFGIFTITPKHMYEGAPLGATVPGEFMRFWACERCEHLPYNRKIFSKNKCLLIPVEEKKLKACSSCGYLKYKQVVGRVLYVVSQIISRTYTTKEECAYRVWSWEYAKPICLPGIKSTPLTIIRHVL